MGGLRRLMPKTWWAMLIGGLALAGMPPLSGFFAEGLDPRRDARTRGLVRLRPVRGRHRRHVPHRPLHVPDAVRRLRRRAVRVRAGAPAACGPRSARRLVDGADGRACWPCSRVRRLDPVRRRVDADHRLARPGRRAAGRGDRRRRRRSRASAPSPLGLAGIGVAWWIYSAHRREGADARGPCSSTSSTSTSCTTGSSTGRRSRSRALLDWTVEGPIVERLDRRRRRPRPAAPAAGSASSRPASSASTRSRSPPALAVLVLVFIAVR